MTAPSPVPRQRGHFGRVVGASIIGTTVEWYDFFLYGSATSAIGSVARSCWWSRCS